MKHSLRNTSDLSPQEGETTQEREKTTLASFSADVLRGIAIGVAFIIPGFSGGSVAAILGIYEKIVGAIADIFRHFFKSVFLLLPYALGMAVGIALLILPIQWGLNHFPIPTVTLFVGLSLGGLPSVTGKITGKPSAGNVLAIALPLAAAAALCFLPLGEEVDLFSLDWTGYLLLVLVGAVGATALVIPGISGSMLLLIFGYYNPLVSMIVDHLLRGDSVALCVGVSACFALGVALGFFGISVLMKFLLKKFPRGTYCAILGFLIGSIPAVYASTIREAGSALSGLYANPWYWVATAAALLLGFFISFAVVCYARRKSLRDKEKSFDRGGFSG